MREIAALVPAFAPCRYDALGEYGARLSSTL